MKTHRETVASATLAEVKRVAPNVIAASEQAAQSIAGSSPASPTNLTLDKSPAPGSMLCLKSD